MLRRTIALALAGFGLWLLANGLQRWSEARSARQTVNEFLSALMRGDRRVTAARLAPPLRRHFQKNLTHDARQTYAPAGGFHVARLDIDDETATAEVSILAGRARITSRLVLTRDAAGAWQISRFERLDASDVPAVPSDQHRDAVDGEQLARDLRRELESADGIGVERIAIEDAPPAY